jgi:regulator of sigma E protease
LNILWQAVWFVVAVGLLVTVHEFGHFWVARRFGFKVLRFSVGFGKPLLRKVGAAPDRTEYVLSAIPLGGYVKMLDEREGPVGADELSRSFTRKPPWQRIAVLLAGPGFNIAFAILILWGMFWYGGVTDIKPIIGAVSPASIAARSGLRVGDEILAIDGDSIKGQRGVVFGLLDSLSGTGGAKLSVRGAESAHRTVTLSVPDEVERHRLTEPAELLRGLGFRFVEPPIPAVLGEVLADGPAARAGLKRGDRILAIDDAPVADFRDVQEKISARPGETASIRYQRGGEEASVRVEIARDEVEGKALGRIRAAPAAIAKYPEELLQHTDLSPIAALAHATAESWNMTALQARLFWRMLRGQVSLKNLSGPLSIAEIAGDSAQAGAASFLSFLVLISLSLGFLNLLPIPILDGGQIVFQAVEWIKGAPLSERAQAFGQQVGIALLVVLMGVALYNDITRQLS